MNEGQLIARYQLIYELSLLEGDVGMAREAALQLQRRGIAPVNPHLGAERYEAAPAKRGPGRPRKNPLPEEPSDG